jgi:phospholipase/carboxylesterase
VIALHGWGASAHDLLGLSPVLHRGEAVVLCPQGPVEIQLGPGMVGYGWFPIRTDGPQDPAEFRKGRDLLAAWIDAAVARYPVDRRKTVLMGFSQGGVMAYDLALRDPERFAGLVALSSWLPEPLAASIERRPEHERLPALVVHGTRDDLIPVDRARESLDRLRALAVPATYREHEMAHELRPEALRDLVTWLDDKVFEVIRLA